MLPTLNNLLENRELALDDGRLLVPEARAALLRSDPNFDRERRLEVVSPRFRVISIVAPCPPFAGRALDPPLRSRLQAHLVPPFDVAELPGDDVRSPRGSSSDESRRRRGVGRGCSVETSYRGSEPDRPRRSAARWAEASLGRTGSRLRRGVWTFRGDEFGRDRRAPQVHLASACAAIVEIERDRALAAAAAARRDASDGSSTFYAFPGSAVAAAASRGGAAREVLEKKFPPLRGRALLGKATAADAVAAADAILPKVEGDLAPGGLDGDLWLSATQKGVLEGARADFENGEHVALVGPAGGGPGGELDAAPSRDAAQQRGAPGHLGGVPKRRRGNFGEKSSRSVRAPRAGGGKSALARRLAPDAASQACHRDLTARDLLQRRDTDAATGASVWKDAPVVAAMRSGEAAILDGAHRLPRGALAAALGRALHDGVVDLPDGTFAARTFLR